MPKHTSIACRQLADFAGRREKSQEKKKKGKRKRKKKRQGIKGEKTFLKINSGKTSDTLLLCCFHQISFKIVILSIGM